MLICLEIVMLSTTPRLVLCALATAVIAGLVACKSTTDVGVTPVPTRTAVPDAVSAELALLETTDLHTNIRSYDYFKLAEDKSLGFERVASLIKTARGEFANTLLFDNGDTIQGTALADYQAQIKPISCDQTLAMWVRVNAAQVSSRGNVDTGAANSLKRRGAT